MWSVFFLLLTLASIQLVLCHTIEEFVGSAGQETTVCVEANVSCHWQATRPCTVGQLQPYQVPAIKETCQTSFGVLYVLCVLVPNGNMFACYLFVNSCEL